MAQNSNWPLYIGIGIGVYLLYRWAERTCPGSTTGLCSVYNSIFGQPAQTATTGPPVQPNPPQPGPAAASPVSTTTPPVDFAPAPRPDPTQYKGGVLPPPPGPTTGAHR